MKKFKSFVAVLLCLAAVFCTAGCSASKKSALNISGAQIDYETFLYYFDQVHAFPEKYELAADATNEQMIDAAIELLRICRGQHEALRIRADSLRFRKALGFE